jgi:hypothetical protein
MSIISFELATSNDVMRILRVSVNIFLHTVQYRFRIKCPSRTQFPIPLEFQILVPKGITSRPLILCVRDYKKAYESKIVALNFERSEPENYSSND